MKLCYYCRGVLSVAWCPQDSDLLLTAAKDNRVLCWNPNSSQPGGEVSKWFINNYSNQYATWLGAAVNRPFHFMDEKMQLP